MSSSENSENIDQPIEDRVLSSRDGSDEFFKIWQQSLVRDERRRRKAAFSLARKTLIEKRDLSVALTGVPQSYHKQYCSTDHGDTVERSIAFRVLDFPGAGNVVRLIVNEQGPNQDDIFGRKLTIQDYLISLTSRTFSWQETTVLRSSQDSSWPVTALTGPLIEQRADHIDIKSGSAYNLNLPRVGGWPTSLDNSIINRLQLEHATEVAASLDVISYQPGFSLPDKL